MKIRYHTLIIGTGCAGYNAADRLHSFGITDIAIITEGRFMGTSRNTGSDKQTFYKLSLCGGDGEFILYVKGESVGKVAECDAVGKVVEYALSVR